MTFDVSNDACSPHGSHETLRRMDKINAPNGRKTVDPHVHKLDKFVV
jgi:hypothetical protein